MKNPETMLTLLPNSSERNGIVVVVITPPLPRDGGTVQTEIPGHTVNLIEIS